MATVEGSKSVEPEASSPGNRCCGVPAGAVGRGKILVTDLNGTLLGGTDAEQLAPAALLTEPNSPADLVETLHRALHLPRAQRRQRLSCSSELLGQRDPAEWAAEIIAAIQAARSRPADRAA